MPTRARALIAAALVAAGVLPATATAAPLGFGQPQYIDMNLAGGEPLVMADPVHHTLLYTSHEGTTHIYRPGLASATTFDFASGYRNQVNMWTSKDDGKTWQRVDFAAGFPTNPAQNQGFSDPDLSQDAAGRIYNTGIDLANDALFSSNDGGFTWDRGTLQCHDGDRPWLAGAHKDEVFLATNTAEDNVSQRIFRSTDGGQTCSTDGLQAFGETDDGTAWAGNGKLFYDARRDSLVIPITYDPNSPKALGVATWKRGDAAVTPHKVIDVKPYAHWPSIVLDDAGGLYMVWDDDARVKDTAGGCDDNETPAPNAVSYVYSSDFGEHWSEPVRIAAPSDRRVFWPWVAAGDKGKISVVWYETDKVVDLACTKASITVHAATILGADTASPQIETVDPLGRPVADSDICQSGTTCVATGEDRRLGDFFTNAIDEQGCVMIATADASTKDPVTGGERLFALPLLVRQNSGPALRGGGDCSGESASLGLPPSNVDTPQPATGRRRCVSRRNFRIRLRNPKGDKLKRATVYVNGKRVKVVKGKRLRARVDLRGLPKGRITVKIEGVTRKGVRVRSLRRYRTCATKRGPITTPPRPKPVRRG
ncbi:MAG TPA: sialidase family protein [Solirubrobacteraceae bacterium]|jgi:hypothetical protein